MARKRIAREIDEDEELDDEVADIVVRRRRRPHWRRRFLVFVAILIALVAFGPTIVAKTPLRNLLATSALPPNSAQVAINDASFSWISGQSIAGVTLSDSAGRPVATIERASIDRSLVALAANKRHLGKIVVTRPVMNLETRDGGSNVEDLLQRIAEAAAEQARHSVAPPTDSSGAPTLAEIEIVEGTILGRDTTTGQLWRVDGLALTARPNATGAWEATAAGVLTLGADAPIASSQTSSPGRFKLQLAPVPAGTATVAPNDPAPQQLNLVADRLPLAPLEPWLARVLPKARLLGVASADLKLAWTPLQATGSAGGLPSESITLTNTSTGGAGGLDPGLQPLASSLQPYPVSITGKLDAADVRFSAAALSGDLIELPTAAIAIDADVTGSRLNARQLTIDADWLKGSATGDFDLAQLASASLDRLPAGDALISGRVDLPRLTRMLPRTLKLREGVRIDSGELEISGSSKTGDTGRRWALAAVVQNLLGHDGTRAIRWTDPVEAGVNLADSQTGPQIERVAFDSPFASVLAEGAGGGVEGELKFNLDSLAAQLGQFVDLSAWQLHGTGQGTFSWRDTGADKFAASAVLDCAQIDVRKGGRVVWVDPQLRVEFKGDGRRIGAKPVRVETGTAMMRGAGDTLELELLEPVDLAAADHDWFVKVSGQGPLDSWAGRLRPWVAAVPAELAGQATVNARLRLGAGAIEIAQSQLSIIDFRTRLGATELIEPRIEAGGDFRYDSARRAIESQNLQIASSTVAASGRGVDIRLADTGPPTVRGDIAFRGDMERIAAWAGLVSVPGGLWPRGQGVGRMQLASDATSASASLTLTAEPFTLMRGASAASAASRGVNPPGPSSPSDLQPAIAWSEPKLELATQLAYTHADDRLQLTNLRLDGQTVKLVGAASVDQLRTVGNARGELAVTYDSGELAKLLAAYFGPGVRLTGASQARVLASGQMFSRDAQSAMRNASTSNITLPAAGAPSHWSRRFSLTTEAGWTAANLYGLPIGAATLTANVRDGQIQLNPLDLAVGQGRLTAQPRVLLDPPPQVLQLAAGPLVSRVAISEEVSDSMLKYAAPILANATRMSGSFSIITEGATVPLGDPKLMESTGRVTMHELSVLPGPGLADVVSLIQRLETLSKGRDNLLGALTQQPTPPVKGISMNERTVDVQVTGGRVYHRNLEFLIDDVPVTSFGSVGFDQTISLVLRVPVQEKWVRGTRELQPLIGQVIEIPVSGTMSRWNVDERAISGFLAKAAQTAVGGAIENELNKALEGLFKPK
jgi:translocation and assembly module TamB